MVSQTVAESGLVGIRRTKANGGNYSLHEMTETQMAAVRGGQRRGATARVEKAYVKMFDIHAELTAALHALPDKPSLPPLHTPVVLATVPPNSLAIVPYAHTSPAVSPQPPPQASRPGFWSHFGFALLKAWLPSVPKPLSCLFHFVQKCGRWVPGFVYAYVMAIAFYVLVVILMNPGLLVVGFFHISTLSLHILPGL